MEKRPTFIYKHDGDAWTWKAKGEHGVYYRTEKNGDGVFRVDWNGVRQLAGTLDFSVAGLSERYARNKIHDFMKCNCTWYFY